MHLVYRLPKWMCWERCFLAGPPCTAFPIQRNLVQQFARCCGSKNPLDVVAPLEQSRSPYEATPSQVGGLAAIPQGWDRNQNHLRSCHPVQVGVLQKSQDFQTCRVNVDWLNGRLRLVQGLLCDCPVLKCNCCSSNDTYPSEEGT